MSRMYIHAMNPKMRKKYLKRNEMGWRQVIGLVCILSGMILLISTML